MDVINDAVKATYLINEDYDNASNVRSRLKRGYFTTNENLGYLKDIDIKNKKVLSVCCSGDQAFMSIIHGAKEVDTFDCNPLQYYILELKRAAILGLDKEEYLLFFPLHGGNINEMYNIKYYDKIKQYLSVVAREFWDYVYSNNSRHRLYLLQLFSYSIAFESDYTRYYSLLKEALYYTKINFQLGDVSRISESFHNNTYGLIMLSNVFDHIYADKKQNECYENEYLEMINNQFYPLLEKGGVCVYHTQLDSIPIKRFKNYPNLNGRRIGIKAMRK